MSDETLDPWVDYQRWIWSRIVGIALVRWPLDARVELAEFIAIDLEHDGGLFGLAHMLVSNTENIEGRPLQEPALA